MSSYPPIQVLPIFNSSVAFTPDEIVILRLERIDQYLPTLSLVYVESLANLPAPVASVITLLNFTYIITSAVDILTNRIVTSGVAVVVGFSSERCSITNNNATSLLQSDDTIILERLTLTNSGGPVLDLDNTSVSPTGGAIDWMLVNINGNIGTIQNYRNVILNDCAFFGYGLVFDGSFDTIAINNSLFVASGTASTVITLPATAIIARRFRIIYSSFVVGAGLTGINVAVAATIPAESYILDNINLSGAGTYLAGVVYTSNTALFRECVGIQNTTVKGIMYMNANATATVIPNTNDYVKVAGTTTLYEAEKYTMPENNQLTNGATIQRNYVVYVSLSFTSTSGNVCEFGLFDSVVGDIVLPSRIKSTANAAGRAENISFVTNIQHSSGDYVEVWCRNTTAANNITVDVLNVVVNVI